MAGYKVSSGVISSGITLSTYDSMYVSNGGIAEDITVNSSGYLCVSYGGVANSTTVNSRGYLYVSSGGTANSTTVNSGGHLWVDYGGVANSTTVNDWGYLKVSSGGTANYTTVNSGGSLGVYSGGNALNIVENGGDVFVAVGANVTFTPNTFSGLVLSNAAATLHSGTVANYTTVNSGGNLHVYSGGTANYTTVNSSGYLFVSSGGTANYTTMNSYGSLWVSSGGTATAIKENGGFVYVAVGANVTFTPNTFSGLVLSNASATLHSGTVANYTTVNDWGYLDVYSGGNANYTTVNSYGCLFVSSGGTANSTTVNSGGYLDVYSGGNALNIVENGGYVYVEEGEGANVTFTPNTFSGLVLSYYARATLHSGTVANYTTVNSGGNLYVHSGGTANYTMVNSGGYLDVSSGGVANSTTVNYGGSLYVDYGGTHKGSLQIAAGASVSAYAGGIIDFTVAGRTAEDDYLINDLSLISGSPTYTITVSANQEYGEYKLAQGTNLSNKTITIGDGTTTYGTITVNGDTLTYGTTSYTLTQSNGDLTLNIAETPFVFIYSSGTLTSSGSTISGTTIVSGGNNSMFVSSGGVAKSTTVSSGGNMYISSGGSAAGIIANQGWVYVSQGGNADDITISKRGTITVSSGGTATDIVWTPGIGMLEVQDGAYVTYVSSYNGVYLGTGDKLLSHTVTMSGNEVSELMYVMNGGTAECINISRGRMFVSDDGIADSTTVNIYGNLFISSGGVANNTVLNNAGSMHILSGGTASNTTMTSGSATVYIQSGGVQRGVLSFGSAGRFQVLEGGIVDFTVSGRTVEDDYLINSLVRIAGTPTYTITVSANQEYGEYKLAQKANLSNKTITIGDGTTDYGTITVNGSKLTYGTTSYTLTQSNGDLTLNIAENPVVFVYSNGRVTSSGTQITGAILDYGGNDSMYISSCGVADSTTNSRGVMYISNGGVANNTTMTGYAYESAFMYISSGGMANNTIVNSDAGIHIWQGGIANSTVVNKYGNMYIKSDGTANDTILNSSGAVYISSGGTAERTVVNKYGSMYISEGGAANDTILNSWGSVYISSGGTLNNISVNSGGYLYVSKGATVNSAIVNRSGSIRVSSGGTASIVFNPWSGTVSSSTGAEITYLERDANIYLGSNGIISKYNTLDSFTVTSGNSAIVYSNGTVNNTILNYGDMYISNGGYADNTIIDSYGYMDIRNGGYADNTIISAKGDMYISSGGTADNITIHSDGSLHISNGGVANMITIYQSGSTTVLSGGTASNTIVNSGGSLHISSGGTASIVFNPWSGTVSSSTGAEITYLERDANIYYGREDAGIISKSGIINDFTITSGNSAIVYSNGTASNVTIDNGTMYISNGGNASNVTVDNGTIHISNGGSANKVTADFGGSILVSSGGTAVAIKENGGYVSAHASANVTYIANTFSGEINGITTLHSGTVATSSIISRYGQMLIYSGGLAKETAIDSGQMLIYSGGSAKNTVVSSGAQLFVSGGGTANSSLLKAYEPVSGGIMVEYNPSCYLWVLKDGLAMNTIVEAAGIMLITSGGIASNTNIRLAAYTNAVQISSGGIHRGTINIQAGGISAFAGSIIDFTVAGRTAEDGYLINNLSRISGSPTYTITVSANQEYGEYKLAQGANLSNKTITIGDGTTDYGTITVNGDTLTYGTTSYTLTQSNGDLTLNIAENPVVFIYSNGTLTSSGTVISGARLSGAYNSMYISNGGVADSTTLFDSSNMLVYSGGTANNTTIYSNCTVTISSGGVANSTTVNSRGAMHISSGGTADHTTITGDLWYGLGSMTVSKGGVAKNTTVGGFMFISSGGTADNTTVHYLGDMNISSGGTADSTTVNSGGSMHISSGGTATNIIASNGARLWLSVASNTYIQGTANGSAFEVKNAQISGYTINAWGTLEVFSGGTADSTTVNSGGVLIYSGGTASNTIVNSGGYITISGGVHRGTLQIADGATVSTGPYTGGTIDFTVAGRTAEDDYLINNLSLVSGSPTYTITVSANQAYGTYKLAQGAENFTNTISIGDGTTNFGRITVNGQDFIYGDIVYSLDQIDGNLTFSITEKDVIPPEIPVVSADITAITNQNVTVSAVFSEDSVVKQYSLDNQNWLDYTSGIVMTENGSLYFRGKDEAGNVSPVATYNVSNIDKIAPTLTINGNPATETDEDIVLTATASDGTIEYYDGGKWVTGNSLKVTENGEYTFRVTDEAGNVTSKTVTVDKIVNPEVKIYSGTTLVRQNNIFTGETLKGGSCNIMHVSGGGTVNSTTVSSGGSMFVSSGGVANYTTVNDYWGRLHVSSGGVANSTTVNSSGYLYVESGGTATDTTIVSGGQILVASGGNAVNTTITGTYDTYMAVCADGSAHDISVNRGTLYIDSNAAVYDVTVGSKGVICIASDGGVQNLTVAAGGVIGGFSFYEDMNFANISNGSVTIAPGVNIIETEMHISSGGTMPNLQTHAFSYMLNSSSYRTFEKIVIFVYSGGVANNAELNSAATLVISSGGVANSTTVNNDGAALSIRNGGTADRTTVNAGGSMYITSGGTATNIIASNGASLNITVAPDTYIQGTHNGSAFEMKDAHISGYTIGWNCSVNIESGGVADSTILNAYWASMRISSGGTANSTTVNSGGTILISANGVINSTTVNSGGRMFISEGGIHRGSLQIANGATVTAYAGGIIDFTVAGRTAEDGYLINDLSLISGSPTYTITVSANLKSGEYKLAQGAESFTENITIGDGTTTYGTITVNGEDFIYNDTVYSLDQADGNLTLNIQAPEPPSVFIYSSGTLTSSGSTISGATIVSGGNNSMFVSNLGTADYTTVNYGGSLYVSSGGVVNSTTVNSSGSLRVSSGGVANYTTINSYGDLYVYSGGTANYTTVNGGYLHVYSGGGTANYTTVNSYGWLYVRSGGIANSTTVNSYGTAYIFSGGNANYTTVNSRGYLYVRSGGIANYTTVNSRGYLYVSSGGNANYTTVNSGGCLYVSSGGVANSTTVNSRGDLRVSSGGVANYTTANSGGYLNVYSGGNALNIVENGGFVYVEAGANVTFSPNTLSGLVLSNAGATLHSGTIANSTTVNPHGSLDVYSGGIANYTTVNSYGSLFVSSGGNALNIVENGGFVYVVVGANVTFTPNTLSGLVLSSSRASATLHSGTVANYTTVKNYGTLYVSSGGVANSTTMNYGGNLHVEYGGVANSTTVNSGNLIVASGGTANSTTVNSGGYLGVYSGGNALNIVENGGFVYVAVGANVTFTPNTFSGLVLSNYASATLHSGTVANYTTVYSDGRLQVYSGGVANDTTVNSSGYLYVYSGGTANYTTMNYGGSLYVSSGGTHKGSLQIAAGARVSAYAGGIIDFTLSGRTENDGYLINDLSRISGAPTYTITVSANQEYGEYKLAQGAESFTGSITIGDGTTTYGTITVNGEDFIYNDVVYSLDQADGNLTLNIQAPEPPSVFIYSSGTLTSSGSTISGATIVSGGNNSMFVSNLGTADYTTVNSGGYLYVSSGGNADNTIVRSSGFVTVSSGGKADNTTVNAGGEMEISSGGKAVAIKENGGVVYVRDGANVTFASHTIENLIMRSFATATIHSNTVANAPSINFEGRLYVYSGGIANNANVNSGGRLIVDNGGSALQVKENGGYVSIQDGANVTFVSNTLSNFTLSGTSATLHSNTTAENMTVKEYGMLNIYGGVANDTVTTGSNNTWITVHSGGTANRTTINTGYLTISSGGIVNNTTLNRYGTLEVSSGGIHRGTLQLNDNAKVSTYKGAIIDFTVSGRTENDGYLINDLSRISGAPTYTITVSANQEYGEYKLAQGAESFTGSITIGDGTTTYGTITVNGEDFIYNDTVYSLDQADGNLTLNISLQDLIPPELTISGNPTEWTNKDITLTATASDGVIEYYNGTTWVTGNQLLVTENGSYQFRATDAAGNVTNKTVTVTKIDKVSPDKPVVSADITTITNQDVTVSAVFSEDSVVKQYSLDNKTWQNYSSGIVMTENGTLYFRGKDEAGNISPVATYSVNNIDKAIPDKPVVSADITVMTNQDVTVSAVFSKDSVIKEYSLDNKTWQNYSSGIVMSENGTLYFRGKDEAGNISPVATYSVSNIDKVIPDKPIVSADITAITNQNVTVSAVFSKDSVVKQYSLDNKTWQNYSSGIVMQENGTLYFRGKDEAGNISPVATYSVNNIDKVIPDKPVVSADITVMTNQNVTVSAVFSNDSVVKQYSLDNQNWMDYSSGIVMTENGTLYFRGKDEAGNVSPVATYNVNNIDKAIPDKPVVSADITAITNQNVTVSAVFSEDSVIKEYSLDNKTWQNYSSGIVMQENGTLYFRGKDEAGNVSDVAEFNVSNIDKIAPTLTINGNPTVETDEGITLTASASDGTIEYYDGGKWVTGNSLKVTENGEYTFRVTDEAGNVTSKTVTVDKIIDPAVKIYSGTTVVNQSRTFTGETLEEKGNNRMEVKSGGLVVSTTVNRGGNVILSSGGAANITTINSAGGLHVYSGASASNTTVKQSGYLGVGLGAKTYDTTIDYAGELTVWGGGKVYNNTINQWGAIILSSGAMADNTVINSLGGLHVYSGATASNTTVKQSGFFGVGLGATANNTTIDYAGELTVWGGGVVNKNTINQWGAVILSSGAAANSTTINSQGGLHVYCGAVAYNTTVKQGGFFGVGYGATTYNTLIDHAGELTVWGGGLVNDNEINQWGAIILSSGAAANRTVINPDGGLHIYNGATAYATEVTSGAKLGIGSGGYLYGSELDNTGTMTFYDGAKMGGWHDLEGTVLTSGGVDASGAYINFELDDRTSDQGVILDNIENLVSVEKYSIEVDSQQEKGSYQLAGNSWIFDDAITLYVGEGNDCGLLSENGSIEYDGKTYSLENKKGVLALKIS